MKDQRIFDGIFDAIWCVREDLLPRIKLALEGALAEPSAFLDLDLGDVGPAYELVGDTAVVRLRGLITRRPNLLTLLFGGTSAEQLEATFRELARNPEVRRVVLDVDSGGGTIGGVTEAARALYELSKVKPTVSVANGTMASAAYWIASAARQIVATPLAMVGSIGVYVALEQAPKEERERVRIVRSVPYKAKPNPYEDVDENDLKLLQEHVGKIHAKFVEDIQTFRGERIVDLGEGKVFVGEDAVKAGLVDRIGTLYEVINGNMAMEDKLTQPTEGVRADAEDVAEAAQDELLTELEALREQVASMEELKAQVAALKEIKAQLERQVAELRADLLIEQYAERIPPRLRAKWRERAVANYDDTKDLLESMAEYLPKETIEEKAEEPVPDGYLVATSEEQARVYEAFGVKYIRKF